MRIEDARQVVILRVVRTPKLRDNGVAQRT